MAASSTPLRVAFVPEHFSTPLAWASKKFGLDAILHPFPSGTGAMITALRSGEVDVAIGLTEGFIAGLGKEDIPGDGGYRLMGTYVTTPLCWAILAGSGGSSSSQISSVADLKRASIGVSRMGSGSHVMGYVLAHQQGWLTPETPEPWADTKILNNFSGLVEGVNNGTADFFMWETFTSGSAISRGEIKKVGEIYTPWSSWLVVSSTKIPAGDERVAEMFLKIDQGVKYFEDHQDEAVEHICNVMDYSPENAKKWLETVKFQHVVKGVDMELVNGCVSILRKAGVLVEGKGMAADEMVAIKR
ncbi:hypothetical protein MKZ38_008318 [Zalerion maritima]|uniref:Ca3427-like PBP 2 domain-containing protein n=1 Tax=Zalerion maritima TaxID=339359 RepID=A0AAD5WMS9_9PEZI|nr:hypothetical protein MKZ38_008318 [Zalerion maritima]